MGADGVNGARQVANDIVFTDPSRPGRVVDGREPGKGVVGQLPLGAVGGHNADELPVTVVAARADLAELVDLPPRLAVVPEAILPPGAGRVDDRRLAAGCGVLEAPG